MNAKPDVITVQRAAELAGLTEQEIIDFAALGKIQIGVIAAGWRCNAMPWGKGDVSHYIAEVDALGKPTQYAIKTDDASVTVPVFEACGFWRFGGKANELSQVQHDDQLKIKALFPAKNEPRELEWEFAPWDVFSIWLEDEETINFDSLRVVRSEIEALSDKVAQQHPPHDETEIRRLQRALGALVLGLAKAESTSKWKSGDSPNVSTIVATAMEGVMAEHGSVPHGYSKTTLTNTIKTALQAIKDEIES